MNYTNREVVRRLKQYDMFLNSLSLTNDDIQRDRICDQLDKIEKQILLETNSEYEEEYLMLLSTKTKYIEEEKTRLRNIISLINERREYLDKRKKEHKKITGSLVELTTFLGEDKLVTFEKRLEIIEKYQKNKIKQEELIKDMKVLDIKISEASRNVKANTRLNESLEKKMISLVGRTLEKQGLYKLVDKKEEIQKKYSEFKYALALAKDNLKSAKELEDSEYILECNNMIDDINSLYTMYNEQINIINLINIFEDKTSNYEELLEKREKINDILKNITGTELFKELDNELSKQYNTIKLEEQDIKTYETLKNERENKNKLLYEIEEENNSKDFKNVLEELIKNENRLHEEEIKKAKKEEYQERQKKLLEEQKIEAARVKRQKLIEEIKLKEQLETAEKMKKLQEKTVIKKDIEVKKEKQIINDFDDIIPKEKEEKLDIKNPLKDKTLDDIISNRSDFDTDELFENTKIVPNKPLQNNIFEEKINTIEEEKIPPSWDIPETEEITKTPEKQYEESVDLFKQNDTSQELNIVSPEPEKEEINDKDSIYDILENNKNIIWKTTDTTSNNNSIPVIGNNKLKPEIINDGGMSFPDLKKKEGEVLWKETL
ncbi:MAG: hypothetical protein ACI4U4_01090 [Bacilli bacterium]